MRIWDLPPQHLCRKHLLGEHRELHAIYSVITGGRTGYAHHPETRRWVGHLPELADRHEALVQEMQRRGYRHGSPLDLSKLGDLSNEPLGMVNSVYEQKKLLRQKGCECEV